MAARVPGDAVPVLRATRRVAEVTVDAAVRLDGKTWIDDGGQERRGEDGQEGCGGMAERPEHAVEEFITGAGRDVLRQALQDHLDARAAAEPRLAEVIGADQVVRRRAEHGHARLLATRPGGGARDLLVLSIDATGVNMIDSGLRETAPTRSSGPRPPSAQLATRERAGRTRMAVVTACYDAASAVRDPADILPATAGERADRRPGPKAVNREVDASLADSPSR